MLAALGSVNRIEIYTSVCNIYIVLNNYKGTSCTCTCTYMYIYIHVCADITYTVHVRVCCMMAHTIAARIRLTTSVTIVMHEGLIS